MTVSTNTPVSGPYLTDGVNKSWQFEFRIQATTQMTVVTRNVDGTDEQTFTSGFTIDPSYLDKDTGGFVIYPSAGAALATGRVVFAVRAVEYAQPTRIGNEGSFYPQTHEDTFDLLAMQIQQLAEKSERTLTAPVGEDASAVVADLLAAVDDASGFADASAASAAASAASAAASASSSSDASDSADLANRFANENEDVAVLPGLFSAKHFMLKSQAIYTALTNGIAAWIHAAVAKTSFVAADELGMWDSVSGDLRKITMSNFWDQTKWRSRAIGEVYRVNTAIVGADVPPSSTTDTVWIELTMGLTGVGAFNNGKLTGESVSGSAPLVLASAVVSFAGSPIDGQTIRLLNTEGRIERPSSTPGTLQNDQMQGHFHAISPTSSQVVNAAGSGTQDFGSGIRATPAAAIGAPTTDGTNGTPRTGTETRMKNVGVKTYMRIK